MPILGNTQCWGTDSELANVLAERVGFEPTERFPVHSISSAASSTTPAPLHGHCLFTISWNDNRTSSRQLVMKPQGGELGFNPGLALTHPGFRDRFCFPDYLRRNEIGYQTQKTHVVKA
jgi:NifB/MoaA-like Fe-S oxidoreductase